MKKIFTISLMIIILFLLVGCVPTSNNNVEETTIINIDEQTEQSVTDKSETTEPTETTEPKESFPQSVNNMYEKYKAISSRRNFELSNIKKSSKSFTGFSLIYADEDDCDISFYEEEKSFVGLITNTDNIELIKNILTDTFLAVGDLSEEEAKNLTSSITKTYDMDEFSKVVPCGEYYITLSPINSWGYWNLYVVNKDEMWVNVNEEEYSIIDREMYEHPDMNIGLKCKVTGIVTEWYINDIGADIYEGTLSLLGDDGKEYICAYEFDNAPVEMKVGDRYCIYGTIAKYINGESKISISYPEKI